MKDLVVALSALVAISCGRSTGPNDEKQSYVHDADSLAHALVVVDTHVDLPYRLQEEGFTPVPESLLKILQTDKGDFDYDRARRGGLDAPFMSIYIPSSNQSRPGMGKELADSLIAMVRSLVSAFPDKFGLAGSPDGIIANFAQGKISLPMGMENGAPIGNDLSNVSYFFGQGIRYITLTHARDNQICDSSYDPTATWKGLSPFGRRVVAEMNRVGIMVDISHVSDSTFYQVIRITKAPVIASHSSCRFFTPGFERNMSDDMIRTLARNGGVIQINFGSSFLDSIARAQNTALSTLLDQRSLKEEDPAAKPIIDRFHADHPETFSTVSRVADHIDHVVKLAGIEHVGIGSDFDGVGDSLPLGLKDVSAYPNLIEELLQRDYSPDDISKICSGNIFRVWRKVIAVSDSISHPDP